MPYYTAATAKATFFLTAMDLSTLPFQKAGGWGCGNGKLFSVADVQALALAKHGVDGLAKKRAAREKALAKKEAKKRDAAEFAAAFDVDGDVDGADDEEVDGRADAPLSPETRAAVLGLVNEARRGLRALCTWDYLRSKNAPNGTNGTIRLERVEQQHFAALIGRHADTQLRSLVKNGAWYSLSMEVDALFGEAGVTGSGGKHNCNSSLRISSECPLVVKYAPALKTVSVGFFSSTFWR